MPNNYSFPAQPIYPAQSLNLTLISLEQWSLVNVSGPDAEKYLQGQLTTDVTKLIDEQFTYAAHCDAKGRMWGNLMLFKTEQGYSYIIRQSIAEQQVNELKKYAIFSKVTINIDKQKRLFGLAGAGSTAFLPLHFSQQPCQENTFVTDGQTSILYLNAPSSRYLIICDREPVFADSLALNNSQQWLSLDIEAGLAIIDQDTIEQFIPQAANIDKLEGISFTKGCYSGQEMIARAKYRGANKRALYFLQGSGCQLPTITQELEIKLENNWRKTGTVLASVRLHDGTINVQAIMNSDYTEHDSFRISGEMDSQLKVIPVCYELITQKSL